ncbi:DUF5983 family protein [Rhodopseudomonas parapalustris]
MSMLDTRRFVIVSTSHVTAATASLLDNTPNSLWPCVGGRYADYGWFVYAHEENTDVGADVIPDDLFAVMTWARGEGFDYILLDHDGDPIEGMTTYEW